MHTYKIHIYFILIAGLLGQSCVDSENRSKSKDAKDKSTEFERLSSDKTGIDFVNTLKEDATTNHNAISFEYYNSGAGVAVGDINNDGKPDVFFSANEGKNRLYLNEGNFKFRDITEGSGINPPNKHWSTGTVMADVNADGWLDIYVCQSGFALNPRQKRGNLLFINNGDNTFTERAAEYGIDDRNESISAAFFDYDKDGDLDLYVLNESIYVRQPYNKIYQHLNKDSTHWDNASGKLYRNDNGSFVNVTREAGLLRWGFGLGLVVNDINQDGWTDIYVANDYSIPDFMFINNGDGTFTDEIKKRTQQVSNFGMGTDINDYNNDGYPDIFVLDMAETDHVRSKTLMQSMNTERFWFLVNDRGHQYQYMFNTLQLNNGNGTFSNIAALAGIQKTQWSWAVLLADLNNDGWRDCYVTNGHRRYTNDNDFKRYRRRVMDSLGGSIPVYMRQEIYDRAPAIKSPNFVYRNNRDLTFDKVGKEWNLRDLSYSNGAAYADFDKDGDLDLVVNNIDHEAFVYKNLHQEEYDGNYLQFTFQGSGQNPWGYNTKVTLEYGDQMQYQEYHPTRGYESSMDHLLHFGLGDVDMIDRVVVEWINGDVQILENVEANQRIRLKAENARDISPPEEEEPELAFHEVAPGQLGVDFTHRENEFNDFKKEILLPHKQSTLGPKISVGDINGDGLEDFYIGGAHGQSGALYVQTKSSTFKRLGSAPWEGDRAGEDMGSHFFDADGDDDQDLYVCSGGGGEMEGDKPELNDRLYINEGAGDQPAFQKIKAFEPMLNSNNVVVSADIDQDGDQDLFVGGAAEPGRYPFPERSYILRNDEDGFKDVTKEYAPKLVKPGSVKDATWTDIDNDGSMDLIVVGEWMPVKVLLNDGKGQLTDVSSKYGTDDLKGWWYSVEVADVNKDGLRDIIVGNVGLNTKFTATEKKPFHVFGGDFDDNGISDIVLSKKYKGHLVPTRGRECSSEQMPYIKEKFPTYQKFAKAELDEILGKEKLSDALHLTANTFASTVLINEDGAFRSVELPNLAQIAPINDILTEDFNEDGHLDLLVAGNKHNVEIETPRYDAGTGLVLLGDGKGHFEPVPVHRSGFYAAKNVKDLASLKLADGSNLILVANNDDAPQFFRYTKMELLSMH